jgi:hypothetical protein
MSKLLLTAVTLCGVAAAAPALSQGYPGSLPYTDARTSAAYEESRGGLLGSIFGKESESDPKPQSDHDRTRPAS